MRVPPRAALILVLAGLVVAAAGPAVAPAAGQPDLPPEQLSFEISVQSDGDAHWRIVTRLNITDASDRRAFRDLADRFAAGEGAATYDVETFRRSAALASEATGRPMRLADVRRTNETDEGTGRLILSFTWTNFGTVENTDEGRSVRIGDAFNTSRQWFPGLTSNATLVVEPPPGYTVFDAPKPVEQGAVVYRGPTSFEPDDLRIVFRQTDSQSTSPGENRSDTPPGGPLDDADLLLVGPFVLLVGALGVWAFLRSRRDGDADVPPSGPADGDGGDRPPAGSATVPEGEGSEAAPEDAAGGAAGDDEEVDLDLLSDEERVEYLLEQNGGRMKQATIVKETGWSNAKVSQLLSAMDGEDRIDKLRIGRENLISLPDEDVADILDDEE